MASYCCTIDDVRSAVEKIRPFIHRTPLLTCSSLDRMAGKNLYLKAENFQKTGSIKYRCALNVMIDLQKQKEKSTCVMTKSNGNHGIALAKVAQSMGTPCYVVAPEWTVESKICAIEDFGGTVFITKDTVAARDEKIKELREKYGGYFVKALSEPRVMAAQGTVAIEILKDNPDIDVIVAAVGGGGLIGGIAIAAKSLKPNIKVIAAEPENGNDCYLSKLKGELLPNFRDADTVADGIRINLSPVPWPIIRDLVDDVITVSEEEIVQGMLTVWEKAKLVIEPASGVAIAAVISEKFKKIEGKNVAVVLCGGNIDIKSLPVLLTEYGNLS